MKNGVDHPKGCQLCHFIGERSFSFVSRESCLHYIYVYIYSCRYTQTHTYYMCVCSMYVYACQYVKRIYPLSSVLVVSRKCCWVKVFGAAHCRCMIEIHGSDFLIYWHVYLQVETVAQFGVIFLLFALGLEFSTAKVLYGNYLCLFQTCS